MTMAEEKFLAFKGLKQYTPEEGWSQVNSAVHGNPFARGNCVDSCR